MVNDNSVRAVKVYSKKIRRTLQSNAIQADTALHQNSVQYNNSAVQ